MTIRETIESLAPFKTKYADLTEQMKKATTPEAYDDLWNEREKLVCERFELLQQAPAIYRLIEGASVIYALLKQSKGIAGLPNHGKNILKTSDIEYMDLIEGALAEIDSIALMEALHAATDEHKTKKECEA